MNGLISYYRTQGSCFNELTQEVYEIKIKNLDSFSDIEAINRDWIFNHTHKLYINSKIEWSSTKDIGNKFSDVINEQ